MNRVPKSLNKHGFKQAGLKRFKRHKQRQFDYVIGIYRTVLRTGIVDEAWKNIYRKYINKCVGTWLSLSSYKVKRDQWTTNGDTMFIL